MNFSISNQSNNLSSKPDLSNEESQMEEDIEETFEEKMKEYLEAKKTHYCGVFSEFCDSFEPYSEEQFNTLVEECKSLDMEEIMKIDMQFIDDNYTKEMNLYSSLFDYYNKYLSWIYNHQTEE